MFFYVSKIVLNYFLIFMFVFVNFIEEEEVEIDVVIIENLSK